MLNLSFTLQGDHEDDVLKIQARGVVAALYAIYGASVLPTPATKAAPTIGPDLRSNIEIRKHEIAAQPPVDNDHVEDGAEQFPDPAAAFGGTTEPDPAAAFGGNAPTTATTLPTGERDSAGVPWDERIHASTKTKTANGQWTRRRNTPDDTYNAVMAELKAANTARTLGAATGLVPPPPSSVPAPPTASPAPSPAPVVPPASLTGQEGGSTTFAQIMKKVTGYQAAGKIDPAGIANLLSSIGATPPSIVALNTNKDLIPAFEALLDDHVAMQG